MNKIYNFVFSAKNWRIACIFLGINGVLLAFDEKKLIDRIAAQIKAVESKEKGRFFDIPMQPWVKDSEGKDSLTEARRTNTIFDYFLRHEGAPYPTVSKLGRTGDGDLSEFDDKLVLTPENFLFINFFAHLGIRGELMAHFISPNEYTFGNTWDEWKRWGRYFDFVRFHTEEMKMLMAKAIFNLIRDDKPDQILQLRDRIVNEIPGQAQELLDKDYNDTRKQRADEIGARPENRGAWNSEKRTVNPGYLYKFDGLNPGERQFLQDTVKFLEEWTKRRDDIIKSSQDILTAGLTKHDAFVLEKNGEKKLTALELLLEKGWDMSNDQKKKEVFQMFLSAGGLATQNIVTAKREKQKEIEREKSQEKEGLPEQAMPKPVQDTIPEQAVTKSAQDVFKEMSDQIAQQLSSIKDAIKEMMEQMAQQFSSIKEVIKK